MKQQQQGGGDNSLDFLWTMVLVILIGMAIWYFGKRYILTAIIQTRYYELIAMDAVWRVYAMVAKPLHLPVPHTMIGSWLSYFRSGSPQYTVDVATRVSLYAGSLLRYVTIPVLALLGFRAFRGNVKSKFITAYQMPTLRRVEVKNWPHYSTVLKENLVDVDLDQLPWAMAMTPMRFCKHHDLLEEYTKDHEPAVRVKKGQAYQVFVKQLGPLWTTIDRQPMYIQALFAVFAAKAGRDSEAALKLLRQMAVSGAGKIDFSGARALLRKHYNQKLVARCLGSHAYMTTVMASMLTLARTDGVLACAEFLWLKKVDRRLWYTLSDRGRQTASVEVAGVFAHHLVESKLRAALKAPYVDAAVRALDVAIEDIKYDPEIDQ